MRHRSAILAGLAAILVEPVGGLAQTPCDLLPETGTKVVTVTKPGPTSPKPKVGPCPPGSRPDGNQCRFPDVTEPKTVATTPREDCLKALKVSIDEVRDIDGNRLAGNTIYRPGPTKLLLVGNGAANATAAEIGGGIQVQIGSAAARLGSSPRAACAPPNCQVAYVDVPGGTPDGPQTLKVFTPKRYATAAVTLNVRPEPTPVHASGKGGKLVSGSPTGGGGLGAPGSAPPQGAPSPTPTVRATRDQSYTAVLGCPGSEVAGQRRIQTNQPSPVFEIRSAQVRATATARYGYSRDASGVPCGIWTEAFQFVVKGLGGQGDVTVSWRPARTGNPTSQLDYSNVQTIMLSSGRWQIVPDAGFPPDFSYTVSFRD